MGVHLPQRGGPLRARAEGATEVPLAVGQDASPAWLTAPLHLLERGGVQCRAGRCSAGEGTPRPVVRLLGSGREIVETPALHPGVFGDAKSHRCIAA